MRHRYHLAHRYRPLLAVVALLLGMSLNHPAQGQGTASNKDRVPTPNASTEANDRKRDGLTGNVRTLLIERVEIDTPSTAPDDARRTLVATSGYDVFGKKIYSTNFAAPSPAPLPTGKVTRKNDDKGNLTELVVRSGDGSVLRKETYSYEFDKLGNWTKMTTFVWRRDGATAAAKPVAVNYRTINYYSDNVSTNQAKSEAPSKSAAAHATPVKEPDRTGEQKSETNAGTPVMDPGSAKSIDKDKVTALKNDASEQPDAKNPTVEQPAASPSPAPSATNDKNQPQPDNTQGQGIGTDSKSDEMRLQDALAESTSPATGGAKPAEIQEARRPVSGGVINGRPLFLPVPEYPASARGSRIGGAVVVKVNVDETGKVTSAEVESGPTMLRAAALEAALRSLFSPTLLSGKPTKVTASINYNFSANARPAAPVIEKDAGKSEKPGPDNSADSSAPAKENSAASANKTASPVVSPTAANPNAAPVKDNPVPVKENPTPVKDAVANSGTNATGSTVSNPAGANPVLDLSGTSTTASPGGTAPGPVAGNAGAPPAAVRPVVAERRPLDSIYKVGVGDILDIQVPKVTKGQSTLFTVQGGGILDYPAIGEPIVVAGMTTDELGTKIAAELKRRALIDDEKVFVNVREYFSHRVLISGLVNEPGSKIIQREAVPLFVVLAQAAPKPEAGRAVITSATSPAGKIVNLGDPTATGVLVGAGDAVHLIARPQEYIYIGGEIVIPGRRNFNPGVTLTQVILECGGVTRSNRDKIIVKVSRQNPDGRLASTEYNLVGIEEGRVVDPVIQAGDRIVVGHER